MDPVGITKACTSVVVPKSSRMMVTVHSAIKPRGASTTLGGAFESASFCSTASAAFVVFTENHCNGKRWYHESRHLPASGSRSNKSLYLVLGCTVFAAAAQVLMKFGAGHTMPQLDLASPVNWVPFLLALIGNLPLVMGYSMSAVTAFLLILALRDGELSMLYPVIAMTYVWVNLLSMYFFHEQMNIWKATGIVLVIGGVALLGRAARA
jgi:multidrug transporter EmrE-like cation transporter